MQAGEKIERGRAVFIDEAPDPATGTRRLWLPDATAKGRKFYGISRVGHAGDAETETRPPVQRDTVYVATDGSAFDGQAGPLRVHAASAGDRKRRGMFTSLPVSSEVGHEVIELPADEVSWVGESVGHWWHVRVSVA